MQIEYERTRGVLGTTKLGVVLTWILNWEAQALVEHRPLRRALYKRKLCAEDEHCGPKIYGLAERRLRGI